jgi:hypothetical protein
MMRDPYDILGVARGASLDEIKAAYRRACKTKHPDMGGSHEAMTELNTAYAFVLNELKYAHERRAEDAPRDSSSAANHDRSDDARQREKTYRDIEDELEELRRAAEAHEDTLRKMRAEAWRSGERKTWAQLTFDDLARFFRDLLNSGLKGVAVLIAALMGVGGILMEANFVSDLVLLGSGLGFFLSLALKSDKGGIMSAALLLFGLMTIWLPPVRSALFAYPLATISVLACLALIFKFAQHGGAAGLMTGGVLALFVIGVILDDTRRREIAAPQLAAPLSSAPIARQNQEKTARPATGPSISVAHPPSPPPKPEPRTLIASPGAMLKFAAGVPYRLKIRSGGTTTLRAGRGQFALYHGNTPAGDCVSETAFSAEPDKAPYKILDWTFRACGEDAVVEIFNVR